MSKKQIESVLELIDPATGFRPWHGGPTLMGSLRGVDAKQAAWKPVDDRHSIWELALHIAYWKYSIRRYLNLDTKKGFGRSPANWPAIDNPTDKQWKTDQSFIKNEHKKLIEEIKAFPPDRLNDKSKAKKG